MTVDHVLDAWGISNLQRAQLLDQSDAAHQVVTINDAVCRILSWTRTERSSGLRDRIEHLIIDQPWILC